MRIEKLIKGLATYVPVLNRLTMRGTGGTVSARYCYSVWLRHLVLAHEQGLRKIPDTVAELGPGDSLGSGLAALLCGSERYFGLDVKSYAPTDRNRQIFDELVELFQRRAAKLQTADSLVRLEALNLPPFERPIAGS